MPPSHEEGKSVTHVSGIRCYLCLRKDKPNSYNILQAFDTAPFWSRFGLGETRMRHGVGAETRSSESRAGCHGAPVVSKNSIEAQTSTNGTAIPTSNWASSRRSRVGTLRCFSGVILRSFDGKISLRKSKDDASGPERRNQFKPLTR